MFEWFNWKKAVVALVVAILTFLLLYYVLHNLLSAWKFDALVAIVMGYLVYKSLAVWEIDETLAGIKARLKGQTPTPPDEKKP